MVSIGFFFVILRGLTKFDSIVLGFAVFHWIFFLRPGFFADCNGLGVVLVEFDFS